LTGAKVFATGGSMMNTDEMVKETLKALENVRKSLKGNPKKAREFLIRAGILNKKGTGLARRYR
jgi:hypothetical protein